MSGIYNSLVRQTFIPLFIIVTTLNFTTLLPYVSLKFKNSLGDGFSIGPLKLVQESWKAANLCDSQIWLFILFTLINGIISILYLPGSKYTGKFLISLLKTSIYNLKCLFKLLKVLALNQAFNLFIVIHQLHFTYLT